MSYSPIDQQLDLCEQQFNAVSAALLDGNADTIQLGSATLQQLAVALVQMAQNAGSGSLASAQRASRIRVLATSLPALRANLLRRSAYVEQALQVVAPAAPKATYATQGRYGNSLRQSGAFNVLSA